MQQRLIILFLFVSITFSASAQLNGGVKGGINISDIIISNKSEYFPNVDFLAKTSFHFGSYVQNTFAEHFAWQVEMLFSNKGYILETENQKTTVSLNYINWPLLLVYKPTANIGIESGIELGFLVSGEEQYNSFDMGINFGARYDISDRINLGLRYNMGLPFKYNKESISSNFEPPYYRHSVVQFSIGLNVVELMAKIQEARIKKQELKSKTQYK